MEQAGATIIWRGCLSRLRCAFRLSQPPGAFLPELALSVFFTGLAPTGLRPSEVFSPTGVAPPLGGPAPACRSPSLPPGAAGAHRTDCKPASAPRLSPPAESGPRRGDVAVHLPQGRSSLGFTPPEACASWRRHGPPRTSSHGPWSETPRGPVHGFTPCRPQRGRPPLRVLRRQDLRLPVRHGHLASPGFSHLFLRDQLPGRGLPSILNRSSFTQTSALQLCSPEGLDEPDCDSIK
jgi:hypothetical protein